MALLNDAKLALDITDDLYNDEINGLIDSAKIDLTFGNVDTVTETDVLCKRAIIAYVVWNFQALHGDMQRAQLLKNAYDDLKTQMGLNSRYRDWGDANVQ